MNDAIELLKDLRDKYQEQLDDFYAQRRSGAVEAKIETIEECIELLEEEL